VESFVSKFIAIDSSKLNVTDYKQDQRATAIALDDLNYNLDQ